MTNEEKVNQKMSPSPASQPLGLPQGSVRAMLTLILTLLVGAGIIFSFEVPQNVLTLWSVALGYYIGVRTS